MQVGVSVFANAGENAVEIVGMFMRWNGFVNHLPSAVLPEILKSS
jgi:hypothetical protein